MKEERLLKKIASLPQTIQQIVFGALLTRLFKPHGVGLTIVGGAAVQFYTQAAYLTGDLDAILQGDTREVVEATMSQIGFGRTTTYRHFEGRRLPLPFSIEFPPAPVAVGSRVISKVKTIETEAGPVRVIRVEDILMDRIIASVEWRDRPSLDQAKLLWIKNKRQIDCPYLIDFAKKEGYLKTLKEVMKFQES